MLPAIQLLAAMAGAPQGASAAPQDAGSDFGAALATAVESDDQVAAEGAVDSGIELPLPDADTAAQALDAREPALAEEASTTWDWYPPWVVPTMASAPADENAIAPDDEAAASPDPDSERRQASETGRSAPAAGLSVVPAPSASPVATSDLSLPPAPEESSSPTGANQHDAAASHVPQPDASAPQPLPRAESPEAMPSFETGDEASASLHAVRDMHDGMSDQPVGQEGMANALAPRESHRASGSRTRPDMLASRVAAVRGSAVTEEKSAPRTAPVKGEPADAASSATRPIAHVVSRAAAESAGAAASLQRLASVSSESSPPEPPPPVHDGEAVAMPDRSGGAPRQATDQRLMHGGSPHAEHAPDPTPATRPAAPPPPLVLVQATDGTLRLSTVSAPPPAERPGARDMAPNIERLVQTMRVMVMKEGVSEATVRLRPEHLGDVSITVRVDGRTVVATVHADSAGVRDWLQASEDTLRHGLSQQGLHLDRLVVQRDGRQDRRDQQPEERPRHRPRTPREPQERFEVVV